MTHPQIFVIGSLDVATKMELMDVLQLSRVLTTLTLFLKDGIVHFLLQQSCMSLLTFQIRMKTAEDLKRLIEGFSSDVSAENAQVSVLRNGLVVHIHTNYCSKTLLKLPKWWLLFTQEYCQNINALQTSIQKLTEKIKV